MLWLPSHRKIVEARRRRLYTSGGAATASPLDVPSLVCWIDADTTTGFGTAGFTVPDLAVNGNEANDATQTVIAAQPNPGGGTLSFDGSADHLLVANGDDTNWTGSGAYIFRFQAPADPPSKTETIYVNWHNATAERTWIYLSPDGTVNWSIAVSTTAFALVTIAAGDIALDQMNTIAFMFDENGATNLTRALARVNGSYVTPSYSGTVPASMQVSTTGDHALARFGATELTGDLQYFRVCNGLPSEAELAILEAA